MSNAEAQCASLKALFITHVCAREYSIYNGKNSRYIRTIMPAKKKKVVLPTPDQPHAPANAVVAVKELRTIFRDAFDTLGGATWLVAFVREDPQNARTFVQAITKLIPLEITGKNGAPLSVVIQMADGSQREVQQQPEDASIIEGTHERIH